MKIMIAARGHTPESPVARGLSNASWYLIVDPGTGETIASPTMNAVSLEELIPWMAEQGIATILTGSGDPHSRILISSGKTLIEFAEALTVGQAVERWKKGGLALLDVAVSHDAGVS